MAHLMTRYYAQQILGDILDYGSSGKPSLKTPKCKHYLVAAVRLLEEREAVKVKLGAYNEVRYVRGKMDAVKMRQLWKKLRGEGDRSYLVQLRDGSPVI